MGTKLREEYSRDVVIASDGVGTKSCMEVMSSEVKMQDSCYAIARVDFTRDHLDQDLKA